MACGKPVIGTRVGGMLDTVVHGKTGLLVPLGNAEALYESIAKLIDNRRVLRKMGLNARKEALKYDWRTIASRYLKILQQLNLI